MHPYLKAASALLVAGIPAGGAYTTLYNPRDAVTIAASMASAEETAWISSIGQ